jgi:hypothetical protein
MMAVLPYEYLGLVHLRRRHPTSLISAERSENFSMTIEGGMGMEPADPCEGDSGSPSIAPPRGDRWRAVAPSLSGPTVFLSGGGWKSVGLGSRDLPGILSIRVSSCRDYFMEGWKHLSTHRLGAAP